MAFYFALFNFSSFSLESQARKSTYSQRRSSSRRQSRAFQRAQSVDPPAITPGTLVRKTSNTSAFSADPRLLALRSDGTATLRPLHRNDSGSGSSRPSRKPLTDHNHNIILADLHTVDGVIDHNGNYENDRKRDTTRPEGGRQRYNTGTNEDKGITSNKPPVRQNVPILQRSQSNNDKTRSSGDYDPCLKVWTNGGLRRSITLTRKDPTKSHYTSTIPNDSNSRITTWTVVRHNSSHKSPRKVLTPTMPTAAEKMYRELQRKSYDGTAQQLERAIAQESKATRRPRPSSDYFNNNYYTASDETDSSSTVTSIDSPTIIAEHPNYHRLSTKTVEIPKKDVNGNRRKPVHSPRLPNGGPTFQRPHSWYGFGPTELPISITNSNIQERYVTLPDTSSKGDSPYNPLAKMKFGLRRGLLVRRKSSSDKGFFNSPTIRQYIQSRNKCSVKYSKLESDAVISSNQRPLFTTRPHKPKEAYVEWSNKGTKTGIMNGAYMGTDSSANTSPSIISRRDSAGGMTASLHSHGNTGNIYVARSRSIILRSRGYEPLTRH